MFVSLSHTILALEFGSFGVTESLASSPEKATLLDACPGISGFVSGDFSGSGVGLSGVVLGISDPAEEAGDAANRLTTS